MANSIPKFREHECELKIPFPIFGNGNTSGKFHSRLSGRELEAGILENGREREFPPTPTSYTWNLPYTITSDFHLDMRPFVDKHCAQWWGIIESHIKCLQCRKASPASTSTPPYSWPSPPATILHFPPKYWLRNAENMLWAKNFLWDADSFAFVFSKAYE